MSMYECKCVCVCTVESGCVLLLTHLQQYCMVTKGIIRNSHNLLSRLLSECYKTKESCVFLDSSPKGADHLLRYP